MIINITLPVYNEEAQLESSVRKLLSFIKGKLQWTFEVVIANNASIDRTGRIADALAEEFPEISHVYIPYKGRGGALKNVWLKSQADVLSYMDIDLSTDLESYPELLEMIIVGQCDLAIGTRLVKSSRTVRSLKREVISRTYNCLVKYTLKAGFSDAQCGFKALTCHVAQRVLPMVRNANWFFDTELLVIAERLRFRIGNLPVCWVEDSGTSVEIFSTVLENLREIRRLRRDLEGPEVWHPR